MKSSNRFFSWPGTVVLCGRLILTVLLFTACTEPPDMSSVDPVNWANRRVELPADSLHRGTTYLSVYSHIYSQTEHRTHDLTATVSMRNVNQHDTVFIDRAEYFDTHGQSIRSYFNHCIILHLMETVEIVIDQQDQSGGSGANFMFDWHIRPGSAEPLFEGVMISTYGQQGLSFTTQGQRVE